MNKILIFAILSFIINPFLEVKADEAYKDKIKPLVDFMSLPDIVALSTVSGDGWPNSRIMVNLRNHEYVSNYPFDTDNFETIFISLENSEKIKEIEQNNKVNILYYAPLIKTRSLLIYGTIEIIRDDELKKKYINNRLLDALPRAVDFESLVILKFNPSKVKSYYRGALDVFDVK